MAKRGKVGSRRRPSRIVRTIFLDDPLPFTVRGIDAELELMAKREARLLERRSKLLEVKPRAAR